MPRSGQGRGGRGSGRSRAVLALIAVEAVACLVLAVAGARDAGRRAPGLSALTALAAELRLTDLALISEPSYCRHPTQADRFAPFSDHPGAIEHFPAGSLVPPPDRASSPRRPP